MRIKSIHIENHFLFENIDLDFCDENGNPLDTIIIAGENGCGKTSILDTIFYFSQMSTSNSVSKEIRIFHILLSDNEIKSLLSASVGKPVKIVKPTGNLEIIQDYSSGESSWNNIKIKYESETEQEQTTWQVIDASLFLNVMNLKNLFYSIYSTVEINYFPKNTSTVTSKELDMPHSESIKSGNDISTEINQLLIDIQNNDAHELNTWVVMNQGQAPSIDIINKRIRRFKNAFSKIFEDLNYHEIETKPGTKHVMFKNGSKEIPISSLSSGEKQIVFRGAFLLKDQQSTKGNIVLIDEPEISMHPDWQKKIMEYYKGLFHDEKIGQTSQIFVATHSPYIIHNSNRYNDKVIVLKKEGNSVVAVNEPKYPSIGNEELIKNAFNTNEFIQISPIVFVEGETDQKYLETYLTVNEMCDVAYKIQWIGNYNGSGAFNTGDTALNNFYNYAKANKSLINIPVVLLYDSDTDKPKEDDGNIHVRCMPNNSENILYKKGIENLLNLDEAFPKDNFYISKTSQGDYGETKNIQTFDKTKLCEYICNSPKAQNYLSNLKKVIEDIEKILQ